MSAIYALSTYGLYLLVKADDTTALIRQSACRWYPGGVIAFHPGPNLYKSLKPIRLFWPFVPSWCAETIKRARAVSTVRFGLRIVGAPLGSIFSGVIALYILKGTRFGEKLIDFSWNAESDLGIGMTRLEFLFLLREAVNFLHRITAFISRNSIWCPVYLRTFLLRLGHNFLWILTVSCKW